MTKKYAPSIPSIRHHRPFDTEYLRELLAAAGLSQRAAGPLLGINERAMRYKVSGEQAITYPEQFMLEQLADSNQQGEVDMHTEVRDALKRETVGTVWTHTGERKITRKDVGKMVVGYDRFRAPVHGTVMADGYGLFIQDMDGIDVHRTPIEKVTSYTLLDPLIPQDG